MAPGIDGFMRGKDRPPLWGVTLLIVGTAVGAGILGIPIKTGPAGLLPTLLGLLAVWLLMLAGGWVLALRIVARPEAAADLPTLYQRELGSGGKWLATVGYLVNYYGIMVAYLAGSAAVIHSLLGSTVSPGACLLFFFVPATGLALFGSDLVRRSNALVMVLLFLAFAGLVLLAGRQVQLWRLQRVDWAYFPATIPLMLCSLAYHNIIPTACRSLGWDRRAVLKSLLWGTGLTVLINLVWIMVVLGSLPLRSGAGNLVGALAANQPATVPLAAALRSPLLIWLGLVFSLCAILTSYLAVATGLVGFWRDLAGPLLPRRDRWPLALIVFGPPLAVVYLYPDLFLEMLDLAGGVGIAVVFGLLPSLILLRTGSHRSSRLLGVAMLVFFILLLGLELAQELGWLVISPGLESWKIVHPRP